MESMQQSSKNQALKEIGCLNVLLMGCLKVDYILRLLDRRHRASFYKTDSPDL
jgi:uncharacterized membrane protein YuzA (DUF378 family)